MYDVQVMGRDVFVRPTTSTWTTMKGSDGHDWIELSREQALMLSAALRKSDRVMVTHDEEDG
jgi:hypothetical protein